jgi:predicted RNA-binding Zn-ribbon protein involved in translation (DUF1610 family)
MFQYDELFEVSVPANELPRVAMQEISTKYLHIDRRISEMIANKMGNWTTSTNPWMLWNAPKYSDQGIMYSGAWTTRAAKKYHRLYGEKIDPDVLEDMGNMLGKYKKALEAVFKITSIFDWKPGDFAERDGQSCWWAGHNYCRVGLAARENAKAILFYKDKEQHDRYDGKRGIGRSWLLEYPVKSYIFNAYGVSLSDTAMVLASQFDLQYKKVQIQSDAYINAGNYNNLEREGGKIGLGYVLAKNVKDIAEGELHSVENFATSLATCQHCREQYSPSDLRFKDSRILCGYCIEKLYPACESCGERVTKVTSFHYEGTRKVKICDECIARKELLNPEHVCSVHGQSYRMTVLAWHTNKRYCPECLGKGLVVRCEGCKKYVNQYITPKVNGRMVGESLCIPCSKLMMKEIKEVRYGDGKN